MSARRASVPWHVVMLSAVWLVMVDYSRSSREADRVHMRVRVHLRAWLGRQAVGNGGRRRLFPGFHFWCMAWMHCMGGRLQVSTSFFCGRCESAIVIFAVLEIWSCSVVSMADWVTDHKSNRAADQRHIGTFSLAWAEASTLGAWSRPCCVVFSWGPTSGHFRPRARVPGCPVPRPKVLQALQGMRWELQHLLHAEETRRGRFSEH